MWRAVVLTLMLTSVAFGEKTKDAVFPSVKPERTFEVEGPEEALRVSFDDLELRQLLGIKEVPVDVEDRLPEWLKNLSGKTVRIRGWMFPPPTESELPAFMLVRDNTWMNFGRRINVDDKVGVRMRVGVTADYIPGRPFDVIGKFTIKSRVQDGELFLLYVIEDAVLPDEPVSPRMGFFAPSFGSVTFPEYFKSTDIAVIARWLNPAAAADLPTMPELARYEIVHILKDESGKLRNGEEVKLAHRPHLRSEQLVLLTASASPELTWSRPIDLKASTAEYLIHCPTDTPLARLSYMANFLDSPNAIIATNVQREFLSAPAKEIMAVKDQLPADKLRAWLDDTSPATDRVGLAARLLGYCGTEEDADRLKTRILAAPQEYQHGLSDFIVGYLLLTGDEGLQFLDDQVLTMPSPTFSRRYAVMQSLRFAWERDDLFSRDKVGSMMRKFLEYPELADLAIVELIRWEDWSVTSRLFELYGTLNDEQTTTSTKRAIIRYSLQAEESQPKSAPEPILPHVAEARKFLKELRQRDPELVREVKEFRANNRSKDTEEKSSK